MSSGFASRALPISLPIALLCGCTPESIRNSFGGYKVAGDNAKWGLHEIEGADPSTFETLGETWARDAGCVFYRNIVVNEADPATFEAVHSGRKDWAKDRHRVYISHCKINCS